MASFGPPSMEKRFLATTFVAIALIVGQSANVMVTAFCPHLQSNQPSCETPSVQTEGHHHDKGHMVMEPQTAGFSESTAVENAAPRSPQVDGAAIVLFIPVRVEALRHFNAPTLQRVPMN